jgi:hypothetical protein
MQRRALCQLIKLDVYETSTRSWKGLYSPRSAVTALARCQRHGCVASNGECTAVLNS